MALFKAYSKGTLVWAYYRNIELTDQKDIMFGGKKNSRLSLQLL